MIHSAYMLNAMCSRCRLWANAEVRKRHGSSAPRAGTNITVLVEARHDLLQHEHDDADADDRHRHDRPAVGGGPAEDGAHLAHAAGALGDAVDALDADGRRPLALGAGRPAAPLAAHVGLAVGVPGADRDLLHGIRVCRLLSHRRSPDLRPA